MSDTEVGFFQFLPHKPQHVSANSAAALQEILRIIYFKSQAVQIKAIYADKGKHYCWFISDKNFTIKKSNLRGL